MPRQSVLEYFRPDARPAGEIAVVWRRGYRIIRWSYGDVLRATAYFAEQLREIGVVPGDRVLLWGENSGEWIAAFLGCLFCGAVAVPLDVGSDAAFAVRVAQQANPRARAIIGRNLARAGLDIPLIPLEVESGEIVSFSASPDFSFVQPKRDDPLEIVFTSGTTAEPRGVVLTHRNVLANLDPIEREIARFRRYERIFHPLRFLDLLPLSHVFGQLLGIFIPQVLGATTVFVDTLNPAEVARTIHDERISVLIAVPRLVESLKEQIERDMAAIGRREEFQRSLKETEGERFRKRWRFRGIHRKLGWKFWAIISGGAALPAEAESLWTKLGYAVIQGYGLTETTSLVTVNHPFRIGRGSIGKSLAGTDVKLADDGEILVRGSNVAAGYWKDSQLAPAVDEQGWFHTGDLGERDASGNLYFKGRSKSVIVTPEGLNVYPGDLEAELRKEPAVRDCVVVGLSRDGNAEACAALLLRSASSSAKTEAAQAIESANSRLASFQKIRRWMVWPSPDFPRTPTQKPLLAPIREAAEKRFGRALGEETASADTFLEAGTHPLRDLLAHVAGESSATSDRNAPLHLSSIERVELLSELEQRYQVDLSEAEFANAQTIGAVEDLLKHPESSARVYHYPRWAQSWPVRIFRAAVFNLLARPAMLLLGWPRIRGRENLRGAKGPAIVVSNHTAFLDAAYVMEGLPERFRSKLAVAMDGELLESMRNPPPDTGFVKALADRISYWLVVSVYNVFPLPMHAGFRRSFAFMGDLIDRGWSVLIFPEGKITRDGRLSPFRAGIGLLATQLSVPVIPMQLRGLFELRIAGKKWARPGKVQVSIGAPVQFRESDDPQEVARELERRVAALES